MIKSALNLFRKHWIFLLILVVGIFLRTIHTHEWFMYSHDQDLAAWIIKDIVQTKHLRLIGQETSSRGVFIGPLFYYLQIPFYFLAGWDPVGSVWLPIVISVFSIWSIYFVFSRIFNKTTGIFTTIIYAVSYLIVFIEREVAPTMPVMLWTIWFLYAIWLIYRGKQKAYILLGFLGGIIWNLNLALALLSPLVLVSQMFSRKKINFKYLFSGLVIFSILMLPFFVFEKRHDFLQIKALASSFTTQKDYTEGTSVGFKKINRVMQLVRKNANNLFLDSVFNIEHKLTFVGLILIFLWLVIRKKLTLGFAFILTLWQILFILFFTFNSINVSEYYLNGMNIVWLLIVGVGLSEIYKSKKNISLVVIVAFVAINLYAFVTYKPNKSGYVYRKAIVEYIAMDAKKHNYPCVSVSYITSPGSDLGYRYLFYLLGLHVNQPKSQSPVYTIVFPHSKVNRLDKSFGALGLVLPDYDRYNEQQIKESCAGENANLTDPMFGFTK